MLLTICAWVLGRGWAERAERARLVTHLSLMEAFQLGEHVRTTGVVSLATERGRQHVAEVRRRDFSQATGVLSRPDGDPPYVWCVGRRLRLQLDVLQPADRQIVLVMASGVGAAQGVTVALNGTLLGTRTLPADGRRTRLLFDVEGWVQRHGANQLDLIFDRTQMRQLVDEPVPLPLAAMVTHAGFLPLDPDQGALPASARRVRIAPPSGAGTHPELIVPAGTAARAALRLPVTGRALLVARVVRADGPFELSLQADGRPRLLLHRGEVGAATPREVTCDLTPWVGQPVLLELWARSGALHLSGARLLVDPATMAPAARPDATRPGLAPAGAGRPSFLLVVLDALARRRVQGLGCSRRTTPALASLLERGTVFPQAVAPASYTLASVGTLLTGQQPSTHGVVLAQEGERVARLDDAAPRLAQQLQQAGWHTFALVTNPNAGAQHGYAEGFEVYRELFRSELWDEGVDGRHLPASLAQHLRGTQGEPFFAYVHVFEPHAPYDAPEALRAPFVAPYDGPVNGSRAWIEGYKASELAVDAAGWRHLRDLYDARVRLADRVLGLLLRVLTDAGRSEDTVVVVTSDHGESLGEHGVVEHGDVVYGEELDVPLVFVVPGRKPERIPGAASLADVAPTVLRLAGLPVPDGMQGMDLLSHPPAPDRPLAARSAARLPALSWTRGRFKLVVDLATRRRELYDLQADPGERRNLVQARPATAAWLYGELLAHVEAARPAGEQGAPMEAELAEQLAQIGYASSGPQVTGQGPARALRVRLQRW